jgi:hypothetical protein
MSFTAFGHQIHTATFLARRNVMPLTPADTNTTLFEEIIERLEDSLDDLSLYMRKRPLITVVIAFTFGFLLARAAL